MFASLPMYERPELTQGHAAYWSLIRANLAKMEIDAPENLSPDGVGTEFWSQPDLLFSQTCGYPYRTALHDKVTLIGTPDYGVPGCPPGYYRSCFVARRTDMRRDLPAFREAVFAYNEIGSQSGFVAAQAAAAEHGFRFLNRVKTGAHRHSAAAVVCGKADIACLDAVTWRIMQANDDIAKKLNVISITEPTPGLPYICARSIDARPLFQAVKQAISDLDQTHKDALMIKGIVELTHADYMNMNRDTALT